jgi:AcrR family transcriptional regulator
MIERGESSATRIRILDAAVRLFGRVGYNQASMEDIAAAVGISKPAIYHHFRGKEAVFRALVDQIVLSGNAILDRLRTLDVDLPGLVEEMMVSRLELARDHEDWIRFMLRIDLATLELPDAESLMRIHEEFHLAELDLILARLGPWVLREGVDPSEFMHFSHDFSFAFIARRLCEGRGFADVDIRAEARRMRDFVLFGAFIRAG